MDERSFARYIASGEEVTGEKEDYAEIFSWVECNLAKPYHLKRGILIECDFFVFFFLEKEIIMTTYLFVAIIKDLPLTDPQVQANWPCHGPCPWLSTEYNHKMSELMVLLGKSAEVVLQLMALGLGLEDKQLLNWLTRDGWHHQRALRYLPLDTIKEEPGKDRQGISEHTDYGFIVFVLAEMLGGDFMKLKELDVYRTRGGHHGLFPWYVPPSHKQVFLSIDICWWKGDILQFLTSNDILATPHKIALNTKERFAFAYFYELNFNAVIETQPEFTKSK